MVMERYDILISGGTVIDGSGQPGFTADVAIAGGKVAAIWRRGGEAARVDPSPAPAKEAESGSKIPVRATVVIDATGKVVCPGFIDIHAHSEWALLVDGSAKSKVHQGVTTEISGNCGLSPAPVWGASREFLRKYAGFLSSHIKWNWSRMEEYFHRLEEGGIALNVGILAGHRTIRTAVMGFDRRRPTVAEMSGMRKLLAQCLEEGALGFSTGLEYAPGSYADVDELVEFNRVVRDYGAFYATHLREEGARVVQALEEAAAVAGRSGQPVHVSHLKGTGKRRRGRADELRQLIGSMEATYDVYPYLAGSTWLSAFLPTWVLEGGLEALLARVRDPAVQATVRAEMIEKVFEGDEPGQAEWSSFRVASLPEGSTGEADALSPPSAIEGRNFWDIARDWKMEPFAAMFRLLQLGRGLVSVIKESISEEDLRVLLSDRRGAIGSDGYALAEAGALAQGRPHPRSFGTFPRLLGRYCRDGQVISLVEAIRKMTSLPAGLLGLSESRGLLREGMEADVVVFDPYTIADRATYDAPHQYPSGIDWVLVNGQVTLARGQLTGARPGRILRGSRTNPPS